jgi:hypothetical protein
MKSCALIGTAGYYCKSKEAPSLRLISEQSAKKGQFYYIRTQVFAADKVKLVFFMAVL